MSSNPGKTSRMLVDDMVVASFPNQEMNHESYLFIQRSLTRVHQMKQCGHRRFPGTGLLSKRGLFIPARRCLHSRLMRITDVQAGPHPSVHKACVWLKSPSLSECPTSSTCPVPASKEARGQLVLSHQYVNRYLGFSSPISATSSSVLPAIFTSSLPARRLLFRATKYTYMNA